MLPGLRPGGGLPESASTPLFIQASWVGGEGAGSGSSRQKSNTKIDLTHHGKSHWEYQNRKIERLYNGKSHRVQENRKGGKMEKGGAKK